MPSKVMIVTFWAFVAVGAMVLLFASRSSGQPVHFGHNLYFVAGDYSKATAELDKFVKSNKDVKLGPIVPYSQFADDPTEGVFALIWSGTSSGVSSYRPEGLGAILEVLPMTEGTGFKLVGERSPYYLGAAIVRYIEAENLGSIEAIAPFKERDGVGLVLTFSK